MTSVKEKIEIGEEIDSGLYGKVYKATQVRIGRTVAVKVITGDVPSKDIIEHAKALSRIPVSSEVVAVFSVDEVDIKGLPTTAMIMEWIEGRKIGECFAAERFSEEEAYFISAGVLKGIQTLHEYGVCHGDLNWGNVLITNEGQPKIIDVDVNKDVWLTRMSSHSREGAIQSDVNYCRDLVYRVLAHSHIRPAKLKMIEEELSDSDSLEQLISVVNSSKSIEQRLEANDILQDHELTPTDIELLRFSGEVVVNSRHASEIVSLAEPPGELSAQDLSDALEVLSKYGFIKPDRSIGGGQRWLQLTTRGFDLYLRRWFKDYSRVFERACRQIVAAGRLTDKDIASELGISTSVAEHIIDLLASNDLLKVSKTNMGSSVYSVSVQLRRKMEA